MKKHLFFAAVLFTSAQLFSQHATFENPTLPAESAWYGQDQEIDGDTIYNSGGFNFENNYNAGWGSFSGWAISNVTDNTTTGWGNQFSAITGVGQNASAQYGLCYVSEWYPNRVFNTGSGEEIISGVYITNTTYAYYSLLDGDAVGKQFGSLYDANGDLDSTGGEDWFKVTIYGLGMDSLLSTNFVEFYLADYRFALDQDDYIIDEWTWVDLSVLGPVKGLDFVLSSSDTSGGFGMNTPAYIAIDNLTATFTSVAEQKNESSLLFYPNPTQNQLTVEAVENTQILIYTSTGELVYSTVASSNKTVLDVSDFANGIYFLQTELDGVLQQERFVKF